MIYAVVSPVKRGYEKPERPRKKPGLLAKITGKKPVPEWDYGPPTWLPHIRELARDENVKKAQENLKEVLTKAGLPEEEVNRLVRSLPILIRGSLAFQRFIENVEKDPTWKRYETIYLTKKILVDDPDPLGFVERYATKDIIRDIYRMHVAIHHQLPRIFEKESGLDYLIPEDERKKIREEVIKAVEEGKLPEPEKKEEAPKPSIEGVPVKNPNEYAWVKDVLGVDPKEVKVHPDSGIPFVIKNGKVIVLPPRDPRKMAVDTLDVNKLNNPLLVYHITSEIVEKSKTPEEAEKALEDLHRVYRELRLMAERGESLENIYKRARELMKEYGEDHPVSKVVLRHIGTEEYKKAFPPDYRPENFAAEYRVVDLLMHEAKDVAKDVLHHPEKYGISRDDPKFMKKVALKIRRDVADIMVEYKGFKRRKRLTD